MSTSDQHSDFIVELGGTGEVARLLGVRSTAVSNWKKRGIPDSVTIRANLATFAHSKNIPLPEGFLGDRK